MGILTSTKYRQIGTGMYDNSDCKRMLSRRHALQNGNEMNYSRRRVGLWAQNMSLRSMYTERNATCVCN